MLCAALDVAGTVSTAPCCRPVGELSQVCCFKLRYVVPRYRVSAVRCASCQSRLPPGGVLIILEDISASSQHECQSRHRLTSTLQSVRLKSATACDGFAVSHLVGLWQVVEYRAVDIRLRIRLAMQSGGCLRGRYDAITSPLCHTCFKKTSLPWLVPLQTSLPRR